MADTTWGSPGSYSALCGLVIRDLVGQLLKSLPGMSFLSQ